MESDLDIPFENEAALAVYSNNPKQVIESLSIIPFVENYRLLFHSPKHIHDVYFDTPSGLLKDRKIGLRLRREGSSQLITLKGPDESSTVGIHRRTELELYWSLDAINRVMAELSKVDIEFNRSDMKSYVDDPLRAMIHIGFKVIQDRETCRQIRIIKLNQELNSALVELDIDSTIYHFGKLDVRYYSLEIEEKSKISEEMLNSIVDDIIERFPNSLKRWSHSKLTTGKAIAEMLNEGSLRNLLNENNELTSLALDRLESILK